MNTKYLCNYDNLLFKQNYKFGKEKQTFMLPWRKKYCSIQRRSKNNQKHVSGVSTLLDKCMKLK